MQMGLQDEESNKWSCEKIQSKIGGKGFQQVHGIDYDETFSPVEKMDSIGWLSPLQQQGGGRFTKWM
jgi:hypothetical protein